jgi:hypothetical protein
MIVFVICNSMIRIYLKMYLDFPLNCEIRNQSGITIYISLKDHS